MGRGVRRRVIPARPPEDGVLAQPLARWLARSPRFFSLDVIHITAFPIHIVYARSRIHGICFHSINVLLRGIKYVRPTVLGVEHAKSVALFSLV